MKARLFRDGPVRLYGSDLGITFGYGSTGHEASKVCHAPAGQCIPNPHESQPKSCAPSVLLGIGVAQGLTNGLPCDVPDELSDLAQQWRHLADEGRRSASGKIQNQCKARRLNSRNPSEDPELAGSAVLIQGEAKCQARRQI
jgi:hypothetical protein